MKLQRFDCTALGLLALAGLASRLPLRSAYLFHWDSVNFAASMTHYDVRLHQPHPPGYVLYSLLGKLVLPLAGDANASLVWLSLAGGVLGIAAMYLLGLAVAGRAAALVAALLTLSSPLHWFYSEVALTYGLEYAMVTVVALLCYLQLMGAARLWIWTAALLGLVGGVRQNDLIFLAPLWALSLAPLGWPRRLGSLAVLGAVTLAWLLPMAALSGGLEGYLLATGAQGTAIARESPFASVVQLALNGARMALYVGYGLLLGVLALGAGAVLIARRWRELSRDRRTWFFALWIAPAFGFYLLFHIRQHGHIFTFLPALVLLTAMATLALGDGLARALRRPAATPLVGALVLANLGFFLFAPAALLGSGRLPLQAPSRAALAERDRHLGERIAAIRGRFPPASTAVHAGGADFHHPDYYLPGYQQVSIAFQEGAAEIQLADGVTTIVCFDSESWAALRQASGSGQLRLPSGEMLYYLTWPDGQRATLGQNGVVVSSR
jgi:hypothetical protein